MALPNQLEEKLIVQLRNSCRDVLKDGGNESGDMFLVRYIRANDLDLKGAELHIRESRRWRRLHKVNGILDRGLETFFKVNYPLHLGLTDRRHRPVVVLPLGSWDLKTATKSGLSNRFTTFTIQCMEALMREMDSHDELRKPCAMPVTQFTVVVDFREFQFSQLLHFRVLKRLRKMLTTLRLNYPETLAKCICYGGSRVSEKLVEGMLMTVLGLSRKQISEKVYWLNEDERSGVGLTKYLPDRDAKRCKELLALLCSAKRQEKMSCTD